MKSVFDQLVHLIHEKLADKSIEFAIGEPELAVHGATRRVVWVKQGGRLLPPVRSSITLSNGLLVKALYTNALVVFAYVSAEDDGALEMVWADVLNAVYDTLGPTAVPAAYGFPDESVRGASSSGERELLQPFEWQLLISRRGDKPVGPTVSGSSTVIVQAFDTVFSLDNPEPHDP
jgi:hypothetical protein